MIFSLDDPERQDRTALVEAETCIAWTYIRLRSEVLRRSEVLTSGRRGLLFLFCNNNLSAVAWYLAAIEANVPVVLLNGQLNRDLSASLVELYRPELVISDVKPADEVYQPSGHGGTRLWRARVVFVNRLPRMPGRKPSGSAEAPGHFGPIERIVPDIPAVDGFGFGFHRAGRKDCVINAASDDAPSSRSFQNLRVFISLQRDDRYGACLASASA